MELKDLAFIASMGTLMGVITDVLYPLSIIIGGPAGHFLSHHLLILIPLTLILNIVYLKVYKFGAYLMFGFVWGFLMFVQVGSIIPIIGFCIAGILTDILAFIFKSLKIDKNRFGLSIQSGFFMLNHLTFMSTLFAIFMGGPMKKFLISHLSVIVIIFLLIAIIASMVSYLLNPIIKELEHIGALNEA